MRTEDHQSRRNARTAFNPPNAKEFESAHSTSAARATFGTTSRSQAGSAAMKFAVGGIILRESANSVAAASSAPAAPRACPCIDLVELTNNFDPKTARIASVSVGSL